MENLFRCSRAENITLELGMVLLLQNQSGCNFLLPNSVVCKREVFDFFLLFRATVICPIIDVISDDTFEYITGSDMTWGGFNWRLNFRWYSVPQRELDRRGGDRSIPLRYSIFYHVFLRLLLMRQFTCNVYKSVMT